MATTISSYSVSLSLDASQYIKNSALSRAETAALKRDINAARSPVEKYAMSYDRLEKALQAGAIDLGTYKRLLDEARGKMEAFTNSTNKAAAAAQSSTQAFKGSAHQVSALGAAAGRVTPILTGLISITTAKRALDLSMAAEGAATQFEVLTGSAAESLRLMTELRRFAERSPITLSGAHEAAKTLLAFNVASRDVIPMVQRLGDVVGGNNERFKMIALAFSQASAAGRLMGQDLLQMINAGFNPLQTISRLTGESMLQLKKRMEEGNIQFSEVANALRVATSEGGRFFGMTERLAQTVQGRLNIALSEMEEKGRRIGDAFGPLVGDVAALVASINDSGLVWALERATKSLRVLLAIAQDVQAGLFAIHSGEKADWSKNINKVLDDIERKEIEKQRQALLAEQEQKRKEAMQRQGNLQRRVNPMFNVMQQQRQQHAMQQQRFAQPPQMQQQKPEPTQREILAENRKQVAELRAASRRQEEAARLLREIANESKQNGFKRIR